MKKLNYGRRSKGEKVVIFEGTREINKE